MGVCLNSVQPLTKHGTQWRFWCYLLKSDVRGLPQLGDFDRLIDKSEDKYPFQYQIFKNKSASLSA